MLRRDSMIVPPKPSNREKHQSSPPIFFDSGCNSSEVYRISDCQVEAVQSQTDPQAQNLLPAL